MYAVVDSEAEVETEELSDEQKEMMSVMGFTDFVSSKVRAFLLLHKLWFLCCKELRVMLLVT